MICILCTLQKNTVVNKQGSAYIAHITCVLNKHALDRSRDGKKKLQSKLNTSNDHTPTGFLVGEWSRPLCSRPQVGKLMGPKPVAGEDQTGFSPDDRN